MSRVKMTVLSLLLLQVGACSLTEPFIDRRREAGKTGAELYVGSSKSDAPVVCYNGWVTDFEKIQKMADEECIKQKMGNSASLDDKELLSCRIMTPTKAKFQCIR